MSKRPARPEKRPTRVEHGAGGASPLAALQVDATLVKIALLFVFTFAVFEGILLGATNSQAFFSIREATTATANVLIRATGIETTRVGTDIFLSSRTLQIDPDCTALVVVAMYAALLIAYPVPTRTKLIGLAVGAPAILVANLVRLTAVAHASQLLPDAPFEFVHDYLFKVFMVAVVIGLWAWWLAYARRQAQR